MIERIILYYAIGVIIAAIFESYADVRRKERSKKDDPTI